MLQIFRHLALLGALSFLAPAVAGAANLTWTFDNDHRRTVSIEFYSQDRNHVWPGNGDVYVVKPSEGQVNISLQCRNGENICYGAWVRGKSNTYWGAGKGDEHYCSDCCAVCGRGNVEAIRLVR